MKTNDDEEREIEKKIWNDNKSVLKCEEYQIRNWGDGIK